MRSESAGPRLNSNLELIYLKTSIAQNCNYYH